jgi:hypothetical protein
LRCREATKQQQQKNVPNEPRRVARISFLLFILFILVILVILFILLIEFNYVLTFLKDARERGAHDDCQESTARSGRAWSHGPTGPLCDFAINTYSHEHARARRRLLEEAEACSCQVNSIKKIKQKSRKPTQKPKENSFGPWPSLPNAVYTPGGCATRVRYARGAHNAHN